MSRAYCGVCGKEWLDDCECKTVSRERWDLAREAWVRVRELVVSASHDPEFDVADLDAMFFAGEECPAVAPAPTTDRGEDSCT